VALCGLCRPYKPAVLHSILLPLSWKDVILAGGHVDNQGDNLRRFAVIRYDSTKFVFSANLWSDHVTSYICQTQKGLAVLNSFYSSSLKYILMQCCLQINAIFGVFKQRAAARATTVGLIQLNGETFTVKRVHNLSQ